MTARQKTTWIAVLDGTQARFFALRNNGDGQVFEEAALALSADLPRHSRDGGGEKPSRALGAGKARGALEPRHDYNKLAKHNFAREVSVTLDVACADRRYDQLVLVAPPRSLGELRELLSERVQKSLAHEVPKNLTKLGADALRKKLSGLLVQAATPPGAPVSRGEAKEKTKAKAKVSVPVSVVFRNMEPSPTVHSAALRHMAKLGRKYGRIVSCRVTVEAPHRHHRKGRLFLANVDLMLPGREITTKDTGKNKHAHEDVNVALRDAFDAAARQLQDYFRRKQSGGAQARHVPPLGAGEAEEA
jgi:protein required for attachment to host cells/ribosome-associated translation inhibitor RaiA